MSLLAIALKTTRKPNQDSTAVTVGSQLIMDLGAEDLMIDSAYNQGPLSPEQSSHWGLHKQCTTNYSQAKVNSITFVLSPQGMLGERGGSVVMAAHSLTIGESDFDSSMFPHRGSPYPTFSSIMRLPNSIYGPASKPITLKYVPERGSLPLEWTQLGISGDLILGAHKTGVPSDYDKLKKWSNKDYAFGGRPVMRLYIAYTNMSAATTGTIETEYAPPRALFDLEMQANIQLREPMGHPSVKWQGGGTQTQEVPDVTFIRHAPMVRSEPKEVTVFDDYSGVRMIPIASTDQVMVNWFGGVLKYSEKLSADFDTMEDAE